MTKIDSFLAFIIAAQIFAMWFCGVPLGTANPCHTVTSKSGTLDSMTAGTVGNCSARRADETARARIRPDLTKGKTPGRVKKHVCICPPATSEKPGDEFLYDTYTIWMPVAALKSSMARCGLPPTPLDEYFN